MNCESVQGWIEDVAAGDRAVDPEVEAHLAACPRCAAALALAQRIEAALSARAQPAPPADFARRVVVRVRTERWREEQRFDRAFNLGLAIAAALIVVGVVAALNLSGLGGVLRDASSVLAQSANVAVGRLSTTPAVVLGAVLLLSAGAFAWWWAEDRYSW